MAKRSRQTKADIKSIKSHKKTMAALAPSSSAPTEEYGRLGEVGTNVGGIGGSRSGYEPNDIAQAQYKDVRAGTTRAYLLGQITAPDLHAEDLLNNMRKAQGNVAPASPEAAKPKSAVKPPAKAPAKKIVKARAVVPDRASDPNRVVDHREG